MRPYEIVVVYDSGQDEGQVKKEIAAVADKLTKAGAQVRDTEVWGRRRLAYEINHKTDGVYALVRVMAEPAEVAEISRQLQITDSVIRHKVVRIPEKVFATTRTPESLRVGDSPEPAHS